MKMSFFAQTVNYSICLLTLESLSIFRLNLSSLQSFHGLSGNIIEINYHPFVKIKLLDGVYVRSCDAENYVKILCFLALKPKTTFATHRA